MNFNTDQNPAAEPGQADGQTDLNESLGEGETAFVTGEPKRQVTPGTLGLFGVLALCGGGMYLMWVKNGPQAASAADVATAETVSTFLGEGEKHVALMKQMLQNTDKVVQQFRQSSAKTQVPLAGLLTNPFRLEAPKKPGVAAAPTNEGETAARLRRAEELKAVSDAAAALKLQSILTGRRPAALINGQMVLEGQQVETLVVERILPDRIVLRSGAYRVEKLFQK